MARKPAQSAKPATREKPVEEITRMNTEGVNSADQSAAAPSAAPVEAVPGQVGREERPDLPATADHRPEVDLAVVCHRKDGRRRAGQKWSFGETRINSAELTEYQLAQLQGDPAFTVFHIEKE